MRKQPIGFHYTILLLIILPLIACTPPDEDPFYTQAAPLPDGAPGDIINSRKSIFTFDPANLTPYPGINSWQIIYQSVSATGKPIAVSGTILVPKDPWPSGDRPIIGYSTGAHGFGDNCAPSYTMSIGLDYETTLISNVLDMGWAVAVSDYEGLGTPGRHTYMVGASLGHVALDIVRAAQRFPEAGLSADAPVGLMGYSQGGSAAGWASEIATTYAPELNIISAAIGGVAANLLDTANFLDGSSLVAFGLLASIGLDTAYEELDLESYLNDRGVALLERTADDVCFAAPNGIANIIDTSFNRIDDYTTINPLTTDPWLTRLAQQELGHVKPEIPIFLVHPALDEFIPYEQAAQLRQDWCELGANVFWLTQPTEHLTGMASASPLALAWLDSRFAGEPAPDNCPTR